MKKEIREELEGLGSSLVSIGNDNPFVVPQNYFDTLELGIIKTDQKVPDGYFAGLSDSVLAEIQPKGKTKVIGISIRKWAAAASIIGVCMLAYMSLMKPDVVISNESYTSFDVELEEALDYLIEHDDIFIFDAMEFSQLEVFEEEDEELDDELSLIHI